MVCCLVNWNNEGKKREREREEEKEKRKKKTVETLTQPIPIRTAREMAASMGIYRLAELP